MPAISKGYLISAKWWASKTHISRPDRNIIRYMQRTQTYIHRIMATLLLLLYAAVQCAAGRQVAVIYITGATWVGKEGARKTIC